MVFLLNGLGNALMSNDVLPIRDARGERLGPRPLLPMYTVHAKCVPPPELFNKKGPKVELHPKSWTAPQKLDTNPTFGVQFKLLGLD